MAAREKVEQKHMVKVFVRQRPYTQKELELRPKNIIKQRTGHEIVLHLGAQEKKYTFDYVFEDSSTQQDVYDVVAAPSIDFVLAGYTCSILAYGQTGTGKTYTIVGEDVTINTDFENSPLVGIVPRAANHIFSALQKLNVEHAVRISLVEIYNEEIRDLLVSDCSPLKIYDDTKNKGATRIKDLTEVIVEDVGKLYETLCTGLLERHVAATNLNRESSRSHTIFTIIVFTREMTSHNEEIIKTGKLHIIDLAGSENIGRSGATEMRAREAGTINKSLLTLGKVIKALATKQSHIPYRESKLTRILQDSLGGQSKTSMIATFSPCVDSFDETLSTLDYAYMARRVANCPKVNVNVNQAKVLKELRDEVLRLRQELQAAQEGEGFYMRDETYNQMNHEIETSKNRYLLLLQEAARAQEDLDVKQMEYDEERECFERTRAKLEQVNRELDEENLQVEKNTYVLNHMQAEMAQLKDAKSVLENVLDTSDRRSDVYYDKYERSVNSNLHNANIAKEMYSAAAGSLREIKKSSSSHVKTQSAHVLDAKSKIAATAQSQSDTSTRFNSTLDEWQTRVDSYNFNLETVVKDETGTLESRVASQLDDSGESHVRAMGRLTEGFQVAQNCVTEKNAHIEAVTLLFLEKLKLDLIKQREQRKASTQLLERSYTNLEQKSSKIGKERVGAKNRKKLLSELLEESDRKLKALHEERDHLNETDKVIGELMAHIEGTRTTSLEVEQHLVNLDSDLQPVQEEMQTTLQEVSDSVQATNAVCKEEVRVHQDQARDYANDFMNAFSLGVASHNDEIDRFVPQSQEKLKSIQTDLSTACVGNTSGLSGDLEAISETSKIYLSDLNQFTVKGVQDLRNIEGGVDLLVHAGDTPVKGVYDYPKTLDSPVPVPMLGQRYMEFYDKRVRDGIFPDLNNQQPTSLQDAAVAGVSSNSEEKEAEEKEKLLVENDDPENV